MKPVRVYPFVILAAALLAYGNSFSGPFIFDDLTWIPHNPHIRHLWPLWEVLQAPHGTASTARPLVCLTLALNYAAGGLDVWGYHAVNLAIHACAALVLFGIVRRTLERLRWREHFGTNASNLAAAVAVCWAVHPLQTEAVTYTIQRTESLMGLFLLLTLYCVIRGHDSSRQSWWYAGAVACCALGMGTKEAMAVAPIIVLLYDRTFLAGSWLELRRDRSTMYLGLAATWLILIALVITSKGGDIANFAVVSPWHYAQNQFGVIAHYLSLAFWPKRLCLDYGWQFAVPRSWAVLGAIIVWPLLAATAWALVRAPSVGFLGAWFFLTLAPSSSLVPVRDMVAERRMYLPLATVIALVMIVAWSAMTFLTQRLAWTRATRGLACFALTALIAGALAWRTAQRNQDYHSAIAIWTDTIRQRPQNARAWSNLGDAYYKAGQVDSAMTSYQRAIELLPTFAVAHLNLGNACIAQGRYNEAITHLSVALRLNPADADAHNDLGFALQQLGDRAEAMVHFRTALRLEPDHARAHYNLSVLFNDLGEFDQAVQELQAVRRLLPDRPEIPYKLGLLLSSHGRYAEACANFAEALRLKPDFEQARQHLRLCEEKRRSP